MDPYRKLSVDERRIDPLDEYIPELRTEITVDCGGRPVKSSKDTYSVKQGGTAVNIALEPIAQGRLFFMIKIK